jgi:hypothetical protein
MAVKKSTAKKATTKKPALKQDKPQDGGSQDSKEKRQKSDSKRPSALEDIQSSIVGEARADAQFDATVMKNSDQKEEFATDVSGGGNVANIPSGKLQLKSEDFSFENSTGFADPGYVERGYVSEESELTSDEVIMHADTASKKDYLRRRGLAKALAIWINRFYSRSEAGEDSFRIHLFGPWGAGKTTLLNLLAFALQPFRAKQELGDSYTDQGLNRNWIIINFNAWRHQHIEPVWWPLYDLLYREGVSQLSHFYHPDDPDAKWCHKFNVWLKENFWRLTATRISSYIAWAATLVVAALWIHLILGLSRFDQSNGSADSVIKGIYGAILLGVTIYSAFKLWTKTLLEGSASAASSFIKNSPDPLHVMKNHCKKLVGWLNHPVMIYIDDLDRCKPEYIVSLLEAIQTLLNDSNVYFIVSADHRWLSTSYSVVFPDLKDKISEPEKDIGSLFMEKVFQLEVALPSVGAGSKKRFISLLLNERDYQEQYQTQEGLEQDAGKNIEERIMRVATEEFEVETKHFLSQFSLLMPSNPRGIKRVINTYGMNRAIYAALEGEPDESDDVKIKLALWTILGLRWPVLQREIRKNIQLVDTLVDLRSGNISESFHGPIHELLQDPVEKSEILKVMEGVQGVSLDIDMVALFIDMDGGA